MHRYLRHLLGVFLVGVLGCVGVPAQEGVSWADAAYRSYRFSLENVMHLAFFSGTESSEAEGRWERLPLLVERVRASEGLRWPRSPETVEPVALAWAAIAYVGWMRQIEEGCQRTLLTPSVWRSIALVLGDLAAQALQVAEEDLKDAQRGLYGQEWAAQIAMLHALSGFALGVADSELYGGGLSGIAARARADALFESILRENAPPWPAELRLQALWVEALAWYALVGSHALEAVRVLHRVSAQLEGATSDRLSVRASLLSALLVAHRLTGEGRYVARAERLWSELKNAWERAHELSVTELGDLAGAFNAVIRVLRLEEAKSEYARFFSFWGERLQIDDGEGSLGRAPVFVTKVAYDRERKLWSVLDGRFSAAGALYTASRLLWLSGSCGEGFSGPPAYGLPQSSWIKLASAQAQMSALSTPPATSPIASAQEPQELAELRSQLETLVKQVTELERRIGEYAERLQRVEQELAELRQRSPSTEELQRSQALLDDLKVRVERLERRASEFPWVWALLALLVIGAVGWLYLRVRRRELGEI